MNETEITITRIFDAKRELVWKIWTEKEYLQQWWGPEGFAAKITQHDFREGGTYEYIMVGPDGKEYPSQGIFKKILAPELIEATDEFGDDFPEDFGKELPEIVSTTTIFEEINGQTKVTITISHKTKEDREKHEKMGVEEGWQSTLNKVQNLLDRQ